MLLDEGLGINSLFWSLCRSTVDIVSPVPFFFKIVQFTLQTDSSVKCALFLSLSHFSGATLTSSRAHYLKSGKDPVIFSIHSLCLTGCLRWWWSGGMGERKGSRQGVKEGGMESWSYFGWGLGKCRKPKAQTRRKPDQGMGGKKGGLC